MTKEKYGVANVKNGKQVSFNIDKSEKDLHKVLLSMNTKKLMYDSGMIVVDMANELIPEGDSGKLKKYGYLLSTANSKNNPWFKLTYRNTSKVPYTMYQYYGKVWENNIPFSTNPSKDKSKYGYYRLKFIGWKSSKRKIPTNRDFLRHPKVITLTKYVWMRKVWAKDVPDKSKYRGRYGNWRRNTIGYDLERNPEDPKHPNQYKKISYGKVTINGYKQGDKPQPKWLEVLDKDREDGKPKYVIRIENHILSECVKAIEGKK